MEPPVVKVTEVVRRDVPIYQEWVTQLNGPTNAQISPRVQGYLLKRDYRDGFFVKKGQLLYGLSHAGVGQLNEPSTTLSPVKSSTP
jgi:hypothetical protein